MPKAHRKLCTIYRPYFWPFFVMVYERYFSQGGNFCIKNVTVIEGVFVASKKPPESLCNPWYRFYTIFVTVYGGPFHFRGLTIALKMSRLLGGVFSSHK